MPSRREASKYISVFDEIIVNKPNSMQRHTPISLLLEISHPPLLFTSGPVVKYYKHYSFACFDVIYYFMTFIECLLIIIIIMIIISKIQQLVYYQCCVLIGCQIY